MFSTIVVFIVGVGTIIFLYYDLYKYILKIIAFSYKLVNYMYQLTPHTKTNFRGEVL